MLYDFKNEHPEININQFLSKTSKFFQQYISRGLEEVQAEKDGRILRDGEYNNLVRFCRKSEEIILSYNEYWVIHFDSHHSKIPIGASPSESYVLRRLLFCFTNASWCIHWYDMDVENSEK